MGLKRLGPGRVPDEINVVIEIPAYSDPVKYEVDKESAVMFVDRFIGTTMRYPCNYGYIPQTLSEDNDPLDVLVISPFPVMAGTVVRSRLIGLLDMVDEAGSDAKLLAVPITALTSLYENVKKPEDVPPLTLNAVRHFFEHYKDLEPNKWVKVNGWLGPEVALTSVSEGISRYESKRNS